MVREIKRVLENYESHKTNLDKSKASNIAQMKAEWSTDRINREMPKVERRYLEQENTLKASSFAAIEHILANVDKHVAYMIQDINYESIEEIEALRGLAISDYEASVLLGRYNGDAWSTRKLVEILNEGKDDLHKYQYTAPEAFFAATNDIKRDCAFVLNNYNPETATTGQRAADIKIQLILSKFDDYIDRFSCSYISEPDFDRPAPLTALESRMVRTFFEGCDGTYDKRERAAELAEQGKGDLISRSEYASYLPGGWNTIPAELSLEGQKLLFGIEHPEKYNDLAGTDTRTDTKTDTMDLSGYVTM
jgi:hypothetical protein